MITSTVKCEIVNFNDSTPLWQSEIEPFWRKWELDELAVDCIDSDKIPNAKESKKH